jgi:hypothetical protein
VGGNVVELEGRGDEALIVTMLAILIFQINIGYVLGLVLLGGDTLTLAQPRDRHDHLRMLRKPGKIEEFLFRFYEVKRDKRIF